MDSKEGTACPTAGFNNHFVLYHGCLVTVTAVLYHDCLVTVIVMVAWLHTICWFNVLTGLTLGLFAASVNTNKSIIVRKSHESPLLVYNIIHSACTLVVHQCLAYPPSFRSVCCFHKALALGQASNKDTVQLQQVSST